MEQRAQFQDGGAISPTLSYKTETLNGRGLKVTNGFIEEEVSEELDPREEAARGTKRSESLPRSFSPVASPVASPVPSPIGGPTADPTVADNMKLDDAQLEEAVAGLVSDPESTAAGTSYGGRASGSTAEALSQGLSASLGASLSALAAADRGAEAAAARGAAPLHQPVAAPPEGYHVGDAPPPAAEFEMADWELGDNLENTIHIGERSRGLPAASERSPRSQARREPANLGRGYRTPDPSPSPCRSGYLAPAPGYELHAPQQHAFQGMAAPPYGVLVPPGARAVSPHQQGPQMVPLQHAVASMRPASPAEYNAWQMSNNGARLGAVSPPQQMSRPSSPGSHQQHGWQVTRRGSTGSYQEVRASRDPSPQHLAGTASPPGSQHPSPRGIELNLQELLPPREEAAAPAVRTSASPPREMLSPQLSPRSALAATQQSAAAAAAQPPPGAPNTIETVTDARGCHQVRWTIDAEKLKSQQRQTVSPSFGLPNQQEASFRLVLCPRPSPDGKGGPCFKKASGWGSVQLKCEVSRGVVTYTISLTNVTNTLARQARGPFTHDFAKQSTASLPKDQEQWDFTKAVDHETQTFIVCLEVNLN